MSHIRIVRPALLLCMCAVLLLDAPAQAARPVPRAVCVERTGSDRVAVFAVRLAGRHWVGVRRGARNRVTGGRVVAPSPAPEAPSLSIAAPGLQPAFARAQEDYVGAAPPAARSPSR